MSPYRWYKRLPHGDRMFLMFCFGPLAAAGILSVLASVLINSEVGGMTYLSLMLVWCVMVCTYMIVHESRRR